MVELAQQFDVYLNQSSNGRISCSTALRTTSMTTSRGCQSLHAKISELTLENDFLSRALGKAGLWTGKR